VKFPSGPSAPERARKREKERGRRIESAGVIKRAAHGRGGERVNFIADHPG